MQVLAPLRATSGSGSMTPFAVVNTSDCYADEAAVTKPSAKAPTLCFLVAGIGVACGRLSSFDAAVIPSGQLWSRPPEISRSRCAKRPASQARASAFASMALRLRTRSAMPTEITAKR